MARNRVVVLALAAMALVWAAAIIGYVAAKNARVTAETIQRHIALTDLATLSAADREKALGELARMINSLSWEERRAARMRGLWNPWFGQMTEAEKLAFIEATVPTGFKQMINAFEEMPQERRQKLVQDATRRLKESGPRPANESMMSEEIEQKIATIGLKTFYSESSAQAKAELAPLMEEMQRSMRTRRFHTR